MVHAQLSCRPLWMICDGPIEDPSEGDTGAESEGAPDFNLESDADSPGWSSIPIKPRDVGKAGNLPVDTSSSGRELTLTMVLYFYLEQVGDLAGCGVKFT